MAKIQFLLAALYATAALGSPWARIKRGGEYGNPPPGYGKTTTTTKEDHPWGYGSTTTCKATTVTKTQQASTVYHTKPASTVTLSASTIYKTKPASTVTLPGQTYTSTRVVTQQGSGSTSVSTSYVTREGGVTTISFPGSITTSYATSISYITQTSRCSDTPDSPVPPCTPSTLTTTAYITKSVGYNNTITSVQTAVGPTVTEVETTTIPGESMHPT